ncbi:MAG: tRNA 2-selenouridine(34) synthase MnmH [Flavobacteriales bacterium]|nr:tRNA 2-selenouridine(34) synthase MnmH [Flavobacteriales bacterium]
MTSVDIHRFLQLGASIPIADVRSPGEFVAGHIPGAFNIPLFSDDERAQVGTLYKQQGRKDAIEKGLEFVGPRMLALAKRAEEVAVDGKLLVHCWRGGMRSNRMAWLFGQLGLQCTVLEGGYKAFRGHIMQQFLGPGRLLVLSGPTGSGKTDVLLALRKMGEQVIDLEGLANHRGSAFGGLGMPTQPTSEQFQNDIFTQLNALDPQRTIWIESESLTIGRAYLPVNLWNAMNAAPAIELDVPRTERVKRLVRDYGTVDTSLLAASIVKLQQNFGGDRVKKALELLETGDLATVADMLLDYYDRRYQYGRDKHRSGGLTVVRTDTGDAHSNARLLLPEKMN